MTRRIIWRCQTEQKNSLVDLKGARDSVTSHRATSTVASVDSNTMNTSIPVATIPDILRMSQLQTPYLKNFLFHSIRKFRLMWEEYELLCPPTVRQLPQAFIRPALLSNLLQILMAHGKCKITSLTQLKV